MNPWMTALGSIIAITFLVGGCQKSATDSKPPSAQKTVAGNTEVEAFSHADGKPYKKPREFVPGPALRGKTSLDPEYSLAWHQFNSTEEYKRIGQKNPAWDADAIAALDAYSAMISSPVELDAAALEEATKRVGIPTAKAIAAGCNDPLIRYLHAHCVLRETEDTNVEELDLAYGTAADALAASDYPSIRKAFAFYRAAHAFFNAHGRPPKMHPRAMHLVRGAVNYLCEALFDPTMPPRYAYSSCRGIVEDFNHSGPGLHDMYESLIPTLEKNWKDHAFAQYIMGCIYVAKGWDARGSGFADTVDEAGWKGLREHLAHADEHLRKSFKIDPTDWRPPAKMITVLMGGDEPRSEMEKWFNRAMTIDTNCYEAAWAKAYYLEPRWHGNETDALEFARQCVESKKWGGHVPLVLPRLHGSLRAYYKIEQTAYYSNPQVWKDIDSAYKRFFQLHPNDIDHRHNYAFEAYRCGQYGLFLEQLPLFTTGTNYSFFGSEASFRAMVQTALAKTDHP